MANDKKAPVPVKALVPITMTAVAVWKTDSFLAEAVELTIVDGIVVSTRRLNRAPDLPASAVGQAQRTLWNQFQTNRAPGK